MDDLTKLATAFRSSLGLPDDLDLEQAAYGTTRGWDSVAHMQLVAAIEDAFGIMMETEDVIGMSSFPVAKQILRDRHGIGV